MQELRERVTHSNAAPGVCHRQIAVGPTLKSDEAGGMVRAIRTSGVHGRPVRSPVDRRPAQPERRGGRQYGPQGGANYGSTCVIRARKPDASSPHDASGDRPLCDSRRDAPREVTAVVVCSAQITSGADPVTRPDGVVADDGRPARDPTRFGSKTDINNCTRADEHTFQS
jgi:hypothetical protein